MNKKNEIIQNLYFKENIEKRIVAVMMAVITMGFTLSLLVKVNMGTDPCTSMNLGISNLVGISLGNWQVIFNFLLLIIVIRFDYTRIGIGTFANMILVGYSLDFFNWVWSVVLPRDAFLSLPMRITVLIPALLVFIIAASVYMAVDLGTAPYDAISFIIASKMNKIPFRIVRICWDLTATMVGFLLGSTIGVITVLMSFALGPVITVVQKKIKFIENNRKSE
jgi:uncharacterized membrane protein YczE